MIFLDERACNYARDDRVLEDGFLRTVTYVLVRTDAFVLITHQLLP